MCLSSTFTGIIQSEAKNLFSITSICTELYFNCLYIKDYEANEGELMLYYEIRGFCTFLHLYFLF